MNIYLFWILFLALWAIVPLMIIKGRVDEEPKIQTSPEVKTKKKRKLFLLVNVINHVYKSSLIVNFLFTLLLKISKILII